MTAAPHQRRMPPFDVGAPAVVVRLQDSSLVDDLAHLRSEVAMSLLQGRGGVTVDVSGIGQISSPTVAAILWARRSCSARRVPFAVSGSVGRNVGVLRSCGLLGPETRTRR